MPPFNSETYADIIQRYNSLPYLNIVCGGCLIRTYYREGEYETQLSTNEGLVPLSMNSALTLSKVLNDLVTKCDNIQLDLFHPNTFPQKKKNKLAKLTGEYEGKDHQRLLLQFLLLLI